MNSTSVLPPLPSSAAKLPSFPAPAVSSQPCPPARKPQPPPRLEDLPDSDLVQLALCNDNDTEPANILFTRHFPLFLRHAERLCGNPTDAQDLCQIACLKALSHLPSLRDAHTFPAWVLGFITNEARHAARNLQKIPIPLDDIDTDSIPALSVDSDRHSPADLKYLLDLLWDEVRRLDGRRRDCVAPMLKTWSESEEWPSVAVLADALSVSHGTAERCCITLLHAWRITLAASEFGPAVSLYRQPGQAAKNIALLDILSVGQASRLPVAGASCPGTGRLRSRFGREFVSGNLPVELAARV